MQEVEDFMSQNKDILIKRKVNKNYKLTTEHEYAMKVTQDNYESGYMMGMNKEQTIKDSIYLMQCYLNKNKSQ